MSSRRRADVLVVEQGLAPTRAKAQALILAGAVLRSDGRRIEKPGESLDESVELQLKGEPLPFVSRGGLKLQAALERFNVNVSEHVCLDVGASTGGFTDCLLQRGAAKVYALDVGYNQLAWSLRQDRRVVVLERENIRHFDPARIPEPITRVVIDVSFISLHLVVPALTTMLAPEAMLVALVKPQFEVGREKVGKGGIVRDPAHRQEALQGVTEMLQEHGFENVQTMESPIRGTKGNVEFLAVARFKEGVNA